MAQNEIYGLTKEDVDLVRRQLNELRTNKPLSKTPLTLSGIETKSDNTYLAYAPKDEFIPAMVGDKPGALQCCIFTVHVNPSTESSLPDLEDIDIVKVNGLQDEQGNFVVLREYVYNVYDIDGEVNKYFQVWRSKAGQFFCERPSGEEKSSTTTSTTTTQEPGSPPSNDTAGQCSGDCIFVWNDTTKLWEQTENNCGAATTSTSTSTTLGPSTSSTTTTECPCPPTTTESPGDACATSYCVYECTGSTWALLENNCDGTDCECTELESPPTCGAPQAGDTVQQPCSPVSTTTSTTSSPCDCRYPDFCGSTNGECVKTDCKPEDSTPPTPDCGQTTTTCDCSSTTTTPDPDVYCVDGCTWFVYPGNSEWTLISNGCAYNCPCPRPNEVPYWCAEANTGCIPTTQPPYVCEGNCFFAYYGGRWWYISNTCTDRWYWWWHEDKYCHCDFPTIIPDEECVAYAFPCSWHGDECDFNCGSTTSSTTADPCNDVCVWDWDDSAEVWNNTSNPCPSECPCNEPKWDGHASCAVASTRCGTGTTTGNPGACCYETSVGLFCVNTRETVCSETHNGIFYPGQQCSEVECNTTPAPQTGACCSGSDGLTCTDNLTEAECTALGPPSVWFGTGSSCSSNPCNCPDSNCVYQCGGIVWSKITDCTYPCVCPDIDPTAGCDLGNNGTTTLVPCSSGNTTTSSTSSTTLPPPTRGACCYYPPVSNPLCVDNVTEETCASAYGSDDFYPGQTCAATVCNNPGSTTSTTTPDPNEDCRFNYCQLICENGFWQPVDPNPCVGDCYCPGPGQGEGDSNDPQVQCSEPGEIYYNRCAFI